MSKRIFITGLSGTLGTALAYLHASRGDKVWGCCRNEAGAARWLDAHCDVATLLVSDAAQLSDWNTDVGRLLGTMDTLYHCAAMKHVNIAEANPYEAHRQNVDLTAAVAAECKDSSVQMVFISSDKACLPQSVYGATKLLGEQIALRSGAAVVRLGNLIGSSGSVLEAWAQATARGEPIRLTDPEMTRFFLPVSAAAAFIADHHRPGKVAIPWPLRAARMGDLARAIGGNVAVTGRRPGETLHQWLVAPGERVKFSGDEAALLLDEDGAEEPEGISSEDADRWQPAQLLAAAGIGGGR